MIIYALASMQDSYGSILQGFLKILQKYISSGATFEKS